MKTGTSRSLPLTGLVFWLYTNYMITDPGTTPVKPRNQVIFGAAVGIAYGVLVVAHEPGLESDE